MMQQTPTITRIQNLNATLQDFIIMRRTHHTERPALLETLELARTFEKSEQPSPRQFIAALRGQAIKTRNTSPVVTAFLDLMADELEHMIH